MSPIIMENIFKTTPNNYNLRNDRIWETHNVHTVNYGTETLTYRGPKTWEMLPGNLKNAKSLTEFKNKIKTWKPEGCACRLCKTYIPNLGFL